MTLLLVQFITISKLKFPINVPSIWKIFQVWPTFFRRVVIILIEVEYFLSAKDFYIKEILRDIGLEDIEVFAARTRFHPEGLRVQYIGPDGNHLDKDFKLAYVNSFLSEGYRIIYAGNGTSDLLPSRLCYHVFAIGSLLKHCQEMNLDCTPFHNFHEVLKVMEHLP